MNRSSIPKSIRFEVFKRDAFKCQYCGASSPDVVLVIDHIQPISKGGDQTNIVNLITACQACNSGKSDKPLSDDTAAKKRKAQLDDLQERREQLEMMAEWQRGLLDLTDSEVYQCAELWKSITKTYYLNEYGLEELRKLIRKFGVRDVMAAIPIAAKYFESKKDGAYTHESINLGWSKIGGICVVQKRSKEDPELHEIYKIRYMLMGRIPSLRPWHVTQQLNRLRDVGYTSSEIRRRMDPVWRWFQFEDEVEAMLAEVK